MSGVAAGFGGVTLAYRGRRVRRSSTTLAPEAGHGTGDFKAAMDSPAGRLWRRSAGWRRWTNVRLMAQPPKADTTVKGQWGLTAGTMGARSANLPVTAVSYVPRTLFDRLSEGRTFRVATHGGHRAEMAADFVQYGVGAIPPIGPDAPLELVDRRLLLHGWRPRGARGGYWDRAGSVAAKSQLGARAACRTCLAIGAAARSCLAWRPECWAADRTRTRAPSRPGVGRRAWPRVVRTPSCTKRRTPRSRSRRRLPRRHFEARPPTAPRRCG